MSRQLYDSYKVCEQSQQPWPFFEEEEIEAVVSVLRSGRVNRWTGEENISFEKEFAESVGCRHAIAVANGTVALELALWAMDVGPGDEVIVSSRTFIATASAVVMRGATPRIADVDPCSQNLTAETVSRVITPKTKAIIAVHLAGWPCEMDALLDLAKSKNIRIVEDCAQAQGAIYKGRSVGTFGDVAAFSFCQDKIMSTGGEGGMLVTNDLDIWQKAWSYKDHGKNYFASHQKHQGSGFRWLHDSFGTNWRMTEIQAAIGRVLLRKVPAWINTRQENAATLTNCFHDIAGLRTTFPPQHLKHAYYKYYAFVCPDKMRQGVSRDFLMNEINKAGVPCYSGSCSEIYLEKAFEKFDLRPKQRLPVAQELGETSLMFLVHPTLTPADIAKTCNVVKEVFHKHIGNLSVK